MTNPSGARFSVGSVDLAVVSDGGFWYDAGAVFGIVPRVMWERVTPPLDDRYRMPLSLNCLLIRSHGKLVLIETGVGGKPGDRDVATPAEDGTLLTSLAALDVAPTDIDIVVNTHLHFDHCGWNTSAQAAPDAPDGAPPRLVPTFPNATYYVSAQEWHDANHPNERTRGTYFARNLEPVADRVRLLDGEYAITDDLTFMPMPGHTEGHGIVVIRSGGEWGAYVGDMRQHRSQLERTPWVSGLDTHPMTSMETKKQLMETCADEGALVIMTHGPYPGVGRIRRTPEGYRQWVDEPAPGP